MKLSRMYKLAFLCILAIGVCSIAFSQEAANNSQTVASSPEAAAALADANKAESSPAFNVPIAAPSKEGLVSLDFQDADIKNVLKVLAYKSGVNIVAGPEVTGTVTIQLNDVPWQKALEVVLATYGYGYEKKANIITVTTIEILKKRREDAQMLADQEPLVTKTYVLNFAKASDVVDSVNKMKTTRGQINFDQRTNTMIIRDLQNNMDLLEQVIKALDKPTPQVLIEAKIIETGFTNTQKLGIDWTVNMTASGSSTPTSFPFTKSINGTFLNNALGSTSGTSAGTTGGTSSSAGSGGSTGITAFGNPGGTTGFSYGTLNATGLSAALELLSTRSDTNVLSDPKIVTLDNQTAKIAVGLKYPLPDYTYNQEQAKLQVSGWNYIDIGIIFEVTPHVNNAGLVTLDLNPKITEKGDLVTVENTQVPILSSEEAKTKVMIKDGQTLVIAGLVKENTQTAEKKVPFVGDLPWIGQAFKKKSDSKQKSELIIFLTPHIITDHVQETVSGTISPAASSSKT